MNWIFFIFLPAVACKIQVPKKNKRTGLFIREYRVSNYSIQHAIDKITHFWCSSHILSLWQYWSRGYQGPLKKSCAQLCKKSPGKKNRFIKRPYKLQLSILYIKKQGYRVWHYQLWSFKTRDTKFERFLHKNQHTKRKLLNFENWTNGEPQ